MPQPDRPRLQVELIGGVTVARFADRSLCGSNVEAVGEELLRLVSWPRLWLDFAVVEEVSAAMLGKLASLHLKVRAAGGALTLANLSPWVYTLFEITRLTTVLDVRPRSARALGSPPDTKPRAPHCLPFGGKLIAESSIHSA
jgi:anti-anti-sigma regulatory factor